MIKCKICYREFETVKSFGKHLKVHKITSEQYYLKYIGKKGYCGVCGKETKYKNLVEGYCLNCSYECSKSAKSTLEKRKKTCKEKFGSESFFGSKEGKEKVKKGIRKKYGVDNVMYVEEIKKRVEDTNLERYGTKSPFESEKIKKKIKQTNLEKYGIEYPQQSKTIRKKTINKFRNTIFHRLINSNRLKDRCVPNFKIEEYNNVSKKYSWICTKCKNEFEDHIDDGHIPRCKLCYPIKSYSSGLEKEVIEFCSTIENKTFKNNRSIIYPLELDIYIPDKNIAIEFDGLYWHSENGPNKIDKSYHLNKTKLCNKKGINLIHIFEDEWLNKQDIIKSIIKAKLGLITDKVHARKCEIKEVEKKESTNFLFENHIQGSINGISVGLYYNNELVSILTMGKPRYNKNYEWEILRFCNKKETIVNGGLSKLIKHFIKNHNPQSIISYCDLRFGKGKGYENCGFKLINETKPNYFYIDKNFNRISRLKFQKHKLQNLLKIFDPTLTSWQNMQLNGYDRIWDCGNNVYEWNETD